MFPQYFLTISNCRFEFSAMQTAVFKNFQIVVLDMQHKPYEVAV